MVHMRCQEVCKAVQQTVLNLGAAVNVDLNDSKTRLVAAITTTASISLSSFGAGYALAPFALTTSLVVLSDTFEKVRRVYKHVRLINAMNPKRVSYALAYNQLPNRVDGRINAHSTSQQIIDAFIELEENPFKSYCTWPCNDNELPILIRGRYPNAKPQPMKEFPFDGNDTTHDYRQLCSRIPGLEPFGSETSMAELYRQFNALEVNKEVKELNFSGLNIASFGSSIARLITKKFPNVQSLDFSNNHFVRYIPNAIFHYFTSSIKQLNFANNQINHLHSNNNPAITIGQFKKLEDFTLSENSHRQ